MAETLGSIVGIVIGLFLVWPLLIVVAKLWYVWVSIGLAHCLLEYPRYTIPLVLVLLSLFVVYMMWSIISKPFSVGGTFSYNSGASDKESDERKDLLPHERATTSRKTKDLITGEEKMKHSEEDKVVGITVKGTSPFKGEFEKHLNQEGEVVARSEIKRPTFGEEYIQHYDEKGNKIGRTEFSADIVGNVMMKHFDEDGKKIGESRKKKGCFGFGVEYIEHKKR